MDDIHLSLIAPVFPVPLPVIKNTMFQRFLPFVAPLLFTPHIFAVWEINVPLEFYMMPRLVTASFVMIFVAVITLVFAAAIENSESLEIWIWRLLFGLIAMFLFSSFVFVSLYPLVPHIGENSYCIICVSLVSGFALLVFHSLIRHYCSFDTPKCRCRQADTKKLLSSIARQKFLLLTIVLIVVTFILVFHSDNPMLGQRLLPIGERPAFDYMIGRDAANPGKDPIYITIYTDIITDIWLVYFHLVILYGVCMTEVMTRKERKNSNE